MTLHKLHKLHKEILDEFLLDKLTLEKLMLEKSTLDRFLKKIAKAYGTKIFAHRTWN